jgi:hypothetical protein
MQEMPMRAAKQERPRVNEMPPTVPEAPPVSQETLKSTETHRPLSNERNQELSDAYEKISDIRRELKIVEDVIADKEADLPAKELKHYQESRDRMLKRLEDLEKKRDRIAKETDPADAEAIRSAWDRLGTVYAEFEATVPAPVEEPESESERHGFGARLVDGFNELAYKLKPKFERTSEDSVRRMERYDRRDKREKREVAKRYDAFLTKCEAELEDLREDYVNLTSLSDRALKALDSRLFKRSVKLHHMTRIDFREVPALRPEVQRRVVDGYHQLQDEIRKERNRRMDAAGS